MDEDRQITIGEIEDALRNVPEDIDSVSRLLRGTAGLERIGAKAMALLLASGADGEFAGDAPGWLAWAKKETGLADSTLYHRLAAGRVLARLQGKAVIYRHLLDWDIEKIYTLSKLPPESREAFLAQTAGVWDLDRDDLRFAADCFLARLHGMPEPERKNRTASPALPGFETMLDTLDGMEEEEYLREIKARPGKAHVAAGVGLSLLDAFLETQRNCPTMRNEAGLIAIQEELTRKLKEVADLLSANQGDSTHEDQNPARGSTAAACDSAGFAQTDRQSDGAADAAAAACNRGDGAGFAQTDRQSDGAATAACGRDAAIHDETARGRARGSGGTPGVHPSGQPDQGVGRHDDDAGRVHPGGGEPRGPVPDPAEGRPREPESADLQQLQELDVPAEGIPGCGQA